MRRVLRGAVLPASLCAFGALSVAASQSARAEHTFTVASTGNTSDLTAVYGTGKDNVYALAHDGALLRSTDGGKTWGRRPISLNGLVSLGGTGADNLYVLGANALARSTDGGATWATHEVQVEQPSAAILTPSPELVIVAGGKGALRVSTDGGKTFEAPEPATNGNLNALWAAGPNEIYAVGDSGTILKSEDEGKSWNTMSSGVSHDLVAIWGSSKDDVYAVGGEKILHSVDGGGTWKQAWSTTGLGSFNRVWGSSKNDVWVFGTTTVLHSVDGGKKFTQSKLGTEASVRAAWAAGPDDVYLVSDKGLILRGGGKSKTWDAVHGLKGPGQEVLHGIWGAVGDFWVVGQLSVEGTKPLITGEILRSDDNGATFHSVYRGEKNAIEGIWGASREDLYAVGEAGTILHASDGGKTWLPQKSGVPTALHSAWGAAPDDVYVVGDKGKILHSADHGVTWVAQKSPSALDLRAVWGTSKDDVWAVAGDVQKNASAILHTVDGGKTWKQVHEAPGQLYAIHGVGKAIYAVGADESSGSRVWHSEDAGTTWKSSSGGTGIPHGVIVEAVGKFVLASSAGGILRTTDGKTFTEDKTNTTADLEAIITTHTGELFAVGREGVLLREVVKK